jgi:glycosyltransferase involved in cell wall biosynthesis
MAGAVRGVLERADRLGVSGWAVGDTDPVTLEVFAGRRLAAVTVADQYRPDLLAYRDGACAFSAWFDPSPPPDAETIIRVRTPDGQDLPGSPYRVPPADVPPPGAWKPDIGGPLALVIDEAAPDPARDAGSVALLSHMAAMRRLGLLVVFAPLDHAARVLAETAGRARVAWLHRLRPMALLATAIRAGNPGVHIAWSVADLGHLRAQRQALVLGGTVPRGLVAAERAAALAADTVVTHSSVEATLLQRLRPRPRAHMVPWSVTPKPVRVPWAQRRGVAFLGSFGHAPNLDAVLVLLDRIMPPLWRRAAIPCVIAGSGAPPWLRRRAAADGRIVLLDDLPDTARLWQQVRVSAAPLRFGAGVKGKVLDSLAAGVPCVCSPMAWEGLGLPQALRAADPEAMAAALLRLHEDEGYNRDAAASGFALLAAWHGEAVVDRALSWALAPH